MEARRCQIQPEKDSERLVIVNELRNNQGENNDEEDNHFIPETSLLEKIIHQV